MQTFALAFAIALLALGTLLNTVVLAYFVWRTCRVLAPHRSRRQALVRQTLAPAHR